jgi:integrase
MVIAGLEPAITMSAKRITKTAIDAIVPSDRDQFIWDGRLSGFGVKITRGGAKVFIFQYRMGGRGAKVRRFTIGKYGKLTVEQARKKAELLALDVANGVDPQQEKLAARVKAVDLAFDAYVGLFTEKCLKVEWQATHKYVSSLLTQHAVPVLRSKPLPDITRRDVRQVIEKVADKTATASNLFAVLRRMFSWAVEREDLERSPFEGMRPPPKPASRDRVLSDEELALIWRGADALGYPFGPMVQLLILTGARRDEIAAMDWSELDRDARGWVLPAARAKNSQRSENVLSRPAVEILDGIAARSLRKDTWPRAGFVFSTTGTTPVSGYSRAKRRLDREVADIAKAEGKQPPAPWRLHDLRRTLATGLQRLGVRFEVTEAVLNHVSGSRGGVAGIYQRHDWADEKRAALEAWSRHVKVLLAGKCSTNVVQISEQRR